MSDVITEFDILLKSKGKSPFFNNKGFSDRIVEKYNLFFASNYLLDPFWKIRFPNESECFYKIYGFVIPGYDEHNNLSYLMIRRDDEKYHIYKEISKEHKHIFLGDIDRGIGKIWNSHHLIDESPTIFIVESWTDALSLEEIGYSAIAMNRVANADTVLADLVEKYLDIICRKRIIIMCDSDDIGNEANKNISLMLSKFGIKAEIIDSYPAGIKDANEWLVIDRDSFSKEIEKYMKGAL